MTGVREGALLLASSAERRKVQRSKVCDPESGVTKATEHPGAQVGLPTVTVRNSLVGWVWALTRLGSGEGWHPTGAGRGGARHADSPEEAPDFCALPSYRAHVQRQRCPQGDARAAWCQEVWFVEPAVRSSWLGTPAAWRLETEPQESCIESTCAGGG